MGTGLLVGSKEEADSSASLRNDKTKDQGKGLIAALFHVEQLLLLACTLLLRPLGMELRQGEG